MSTHVEINTSNTVEQTADAIRAKAPHITPENAVIFARAIHARLRSPHETAAALANATGMPLGDAQNAVWAAIDKYDRGEDARLASRPPSETLVISMDQLTRLIMAQYGLDYGTAQNEAFALARKQGWELSTPPKHNSNDSIG